MRWTTETLPQPWEHEGGSRDDYIAHALRQEAEGARLVIENIDGYEDPMDEPDSWIVDAIFYTDYHTGQHIWGYSPNELDDPRPHTQGFVVVERRQVEV